MTVHTLTLIAPGATHDTSERLILTPETELWNGSQNSHVFDTPQRIRTRAFAELIHTNIVSSIITKYIIAQVGDSYRTYTYSRVSGWLTLNADGTGIRVHPVEQDTIHDVSIVVGFNKAIQPAAMEDQEDTYDIEQAMHEIAETEPVVEKSISVTLDELSQFQNTHPDDADRIPSVGENAFKAPMGEKRYNPTEPTQETWTPQLGMFVNVVGHKKYNPEQVFIISSCTWEVEYGRMLYALRPLNREAPCIDMPATYVKPFKVPL